MAVLVVDLLEKIEIKNNQFSPAITEISLGQTLIFKNLDSSPHQVAADPYPNSDLPDLFSGDLFKNQTWDYVFKKSGTFGIHLDDNPSVLGKVMVR